MRIVKGHPSHLVRPGYSVKVSGKWWRVLRRVGGGTYELERRKRRSHLTETVLVTARYIQDVRVEGIYVPVHFSLLTPQAQMSLPEDIATKEHRAKIAEGMKLLRSMKNYCHRVIRSVEHLEKVLKGQTAKRIKCEQIFKVTQLQ